jgi:hypothetical protein
MFAWRLSGFARDRCTGRTPSHRLDRPDQALPVAQRYPELFKIVFSQLRQHIKIDSVLDERWRVLFELEKEIRTAKSYVRFTPAADMCDATKDVR